MPTSKLALSFVLAAAITAPAFAQSQTPATKSVPAAPPAKSAPAAAKSTPAPSQPAAMPKVTAAVPTDYVIGPEDMLPAIASASRMVVSLFSWSTPGLLTSPSTEMR